MEQGDVVTREEAIETLANLPRASFAKHNASPFYEAIDMAVSALREQPRWISVEESLPTPFVSVLVYMPEEHPLPTVHEGYVTRDGKWYAHYFDRNPGEVTHWMPMPTKEEV